MSDEIKNSAVFTKLVSAAERQLAVPADDISLTSRFIDDLGADSLDLLELVMELEEIFDIELADEEIEPIQTVGEMVTLLESKVKR